MLFAGAKSGGELHIETLEISPQWQRLLFGFCHLVHGGLEALNILRHYLK